MRIGAGARSRKQRYLLYSAEGTRYLILEPLGNLEERRDGDEKLISRFNLFSGRDERHPKPLPQTPARTAFRIHVMEEATAVQQTHIGEASSRRKNGASRPWF